jgi:hypothetical protein
MKIAVYGISRSGKDYFIALYLQHLCTNAIHVKGSSELRALSQSLFDSRFNELEDEQKELVRKLFAQRLDQIESNHDYVFVDGHYSFPNHSDGFDVVMTHDDLVAYDAFVYLLRPASRIMDNVKGNTAHAYYDYLSDTAHVEKWLSFDYAGFISAVRQAGKPLIVVDSSFEDASSFFQAFLQNPSEFHEMAITDNVVKQITKKFPINTHLILTDCDKTISMEDTTKILLRDANIDPKYLKSIFTDDTYTMFQFYRLHRFLKDINKDDGEGVFFPKTKTLMNTPLLELLKQRPSNCVLIGITTGSLDEWHDIHCQHRIFDLLVGKGAHCYPSSINVYVTPIVKEKVAERLRTCGYRVSAIGDSFIDLGMLSEADNGYLVANDKLDQRILVRLGQEKYKRLVQFAFNRCKYDGVPEAEVIQW